jgi:hypothetical protein
MREIRTSGLMSGDGRRGDAGWPSYRAHPRLYAGVEQEAGDPRGFLILFIFRNG